MKIRTFLLAAAASTLIPNAGYALVTYVDTTGGRVSLSTEGTQRVEIKYQRLENRLAENYRDLIRLQREDDLLKGLGQAREPGSKDQPDPSTGENANTTGDQCGNPIIVSSGNKIELETDFQLSFLGGLNLTRTYNLNSSQVGMFGARWASIFDQRAIRGGSNGAGGPATITLFRADGSTSKYSYQADGLWHAGTGAADKTSYMWVNGNRHYYYAANGDQEVYAAGGSLLQLIDSQGTYWTLNYSNPDLPIAYNSPNTTLFSAVHSGGRQIIFQWGATSAGTRVTKITDPALSEYKYTYLITGLDTVTYPATYHGVDDVTSSDVIKYIMASNGSLLGKSLNGVRYSTFGYDLYGRATSSEHAGGVEKVLFDYTVPGQTTVTNALGSKTTYLFNAASDTIGTNGAASTYCPATSTTTVISADAKSRIDKDPNGYQVQTLFDADGDIVSEIRGYGTATPQLTTYTWDTSAYPKRLVVVTSPQTKRTITYDAARQRVISETLESLTGSYVAKTTTHTYASSGANGIPPSITTDGPVSGSGDAVTRYFNAAGDLIQRSSSLGNETFSDHNGLGLPTRYTDVNGVVSTFAYDARGRLHVETKNGVTRRMGHNVLGGVTSDQGPSGFTVTNNYDAAMRVMSVSYQEPAFPEDYDAIPQSLLTYSRDAASNVSSATAVRKTWTVVECLRSPVPGDEQSALASPNSPPCDPGANETTTIYSRQFTDFDEQNRVRAVRGNNGQQLAYGYTLGGQLKTLTNAANTVVASTVFDEHWRSKEVTNGGGRVTKFGYDAENNLTSVTDGRGKITTYTRNGLGLVDKLVSPDTATTSYTYNADGSLRTETPVDGNVKTYGYLADGRLSTLQSSRGVTRTFTYDNCAYGKGRICSIAESTGESLAYAHTPLGNLSSQIAVVNGTSYTTSWTYDAFGQLATASYPDGSLITYGWADGKISSVSVKVNGATTILASGIKYAPFGAIESFTSPGMARVYKRDLDGRMSSLSTLAQTRGYTYNTLDQLTNISGGDNQDITYNLNGEVETFTQSGVTTTILYNANGNRTKTSYSNSPAVTYTVSAANNWLQSLTWNGTTRSISTNASGRVWRDARSATQTDCLTYDAFERLSNFKRYTGATATCASPLPPLQNGGSYKYNGLGQRSFKNADGTLTSFVYDPQGHLLFETGTRGSKAYIWLEDKIIGMVYNGAVYQVFTDHLGRPEAVTNAAGVKVWAATNKPFDRSVTLNQINGFDVGFPGQYWDGESSLWQNWHRYYDATVGRYTQSDPIGLAGGINTYAYVDGNPLSFADIEGLYRETVAAGGAGGSGGSGFSAGPNFVVTARGVAIPVPSGAVGPRPVINRAGNTTGFAYTGGSGGNSLNSRACSVRIMDPTQPNGPSPGYSNGYANYQNSSGQSVNPWTGQTVAPSSPAWHLPLGN